MLARIVNDQRPHDEVPGRRVARSDIHLEMQRVEADLRRLERRIAEIYRPAAGRRHDSARTGRERL